MERIIVKGPDFFAVTEDGKLMEYIPALSGEQNGAILLGRIDRLMPGMNCAFVDIGRKKSGFLPLDGNSESFNGDKIRSGNMEILQIKKEETGNKGALLTRDIALAGSLVILMPMNRYVGVSSRIKDPDMRQKLKKAGEEFSRGRFGLVMRNAAQEAYSDAVQEETEALYSTWLDIVSHAAEGGKAGTLLFTDDPVQRLKEDYPEYAETEVSQLSSDLFRQMKQASERIIRLPGGGNIVIDRCEAMTVIDVNTASMHVKGSKEQTVTDTNLEACSLIAQQVRLRNLSGMILIDFINMDREKDQDLILDRLAACFSNDRIKTVIHGWTRLGLMEMTRKRTRTELSGKTIQNISYITERK